MNRPAALEERVTVRGVEFYTRSLGAGPDVVVLHGGPGAHHDYLLPQFDTLATGRRLRYYDQRGGGRSPVARDVPVEWKSHVADLAGLLDAWGIERATVLGYSWGGLLAMLFALDHPDRIQRLALVSPAPASASGRTRFETTFQERMQSPAVQDARRELQSSGLRESDPAAYKQRAFHLSVAGYFRDFTNVEDLTPFRVTGRTQRAVWDSLGAYDLRRGLRSLQITSRVFHGRHDPIPIDTAEETARLLGTNVIVFEESGHCPYVEEPERFTRELDAWLPT